MKDRFFLSLLVILSLSAIHLQAQQKSRIAVLPFTGVEVPAHEARVVTSLFETAMVKTGMYSVIEQNQITDILEAQAFSLSGCTDDACAVEVGKLLAAELIVLGELSKVGGRYIANAKIVDVGLGRNVNADSVSAADIAEMTDTAVNLLAYKLAGLTYASGGGERIAEAFGEIFVKTDPKGAEVFVNGMRRGTSPILLEKVPLGKIAISVRKDNMTGEVEVELTSADLIEIEISLELSLGRLFIKSSEEDVIVFFDGKSLGPLGSGLFRDLPAGEHTVVLKGEGLYWEGKVAIAADASVTLEAWPRAFGSLRYDLPEGTVCELTGTGGSEKLTGRGGLDLPIGSYRLSVSGDRYLPLEERIDIERGREVSFAPRLEYTEKYKEHLAEEELADTRSRLEGKLMDLEEALKTGISSAESVLNELEMARDLVKEITNSGYSFPLISEKAEELLIMTIGNRIDELEANIARAEKQLDSFNTIRWVAFGTGAAGFLLSGVFYFVGAAELEVYDAAELSDDILESHRRLALYAGFQTCGLVAGGMGMAVGMILPQNNKGIADWREEKIRLAGELSGLEGGM